MRSLVTLVALAGCSAGCVVTVYQPLSGLHDPVVVDPGRPNLADVQLDLHCAVGSGLSDAEATVLCDRLRAAFEGQGASVAVRVGDGVAGPPLAEAGSAPRVPLSLDLRPVLTEDAGHPFSWLLFTASFTLLPGVVDSSFRLDASVRHGDGAPLAQETLEGRIVARHGVGPWLGTRALDLGRKKSDKLGTDVASRDLSADLYGRLSQLVFDARMTSRVLAAAGEP